MMRILLFVATNLAVVLVASITLSLFGFNGFMAANGVDLNLSQLLVFCAVFGFAGSLVSLFISKWMAKMTTGTQIITQPRTRHEQWLLQTVEELSREAGIKMPEVGIFPAYEANAFATGWNRNDAWWPFPRACWSASRPTRCVRCWLTRSATWPTVTWSPWRWCKVW